MKLEIESATQKGSREENMDVFVVKEPGGSHGVWDTTASPLLAAVLDGVGSLHHSGLGASLAAEKLSRVFYYTAGEEEPVQTPAERLLEAANAANDKVQALNHSLGRFDGASTLTAAAFSGDQMHLIALGDSPAYLWRDNTLTPLFTPQNGVYGQLTQYLGKDAPDFVTTDVELHPKDIVLLATDGILERCWLRVALRLGLSAEAMVKWSTAKKYADNTTIVKIKVLKGDEKV